MFDVIRRFQWATSRRIGLTLLGIWIVFFFAVNLSIASLNNITVPVLGLPLGVYVAAQGALVLFVIMVAWFVRRAR
jgi:putative solute:sodium symporter small subunit